MPDGNNQPENDRLKAARATWDQEAATFDQEPDHGLRDPAVRAAWERLLAANLPPPPANVLDMGCGTGSLSVLMAEQGYTVTGVDVSPEMIARARDKADAARVSVEFQVMDAAHPLLKPARFDALVCRHLLWALPEPARVLERWVMLLKPGGRLLLVEGFWHTGAGLHAADITGMLPDILTDALVHNLIGQSDLWGKTVTDERYAITSRRKAA